jgi:hypothetical protein
MNWTPRLPANAYPAIFSAAFDDDAPLYRDLATQFGTTVSSIKQWVMRLRIEHNELFRATVREMVCNREDVVEEERYLRGILAQPPVGAESL